MTRIRWNARGSSSAFSRTNNMPTPFTYSRTDLPTATPQSVAEVASVIREAATAGRAVLIRGGGTKWSLGHQPKHDAGVLCTGSLTGIVEYDPGELTFTAKAGTPLAEIEAALSANGQYLPFDPPFASAGATLGGTIAAGLSGPRRMRYGGLRDFVIGVEYVSADSLNVHSGGKVVKNAAGYDLPKLFCGSLGTLGVLTQVSFKVFPMPQAHRTLLAGLGSAPAVQSAMLAIQRSPLEVSAADAWPAGVIAEAPDLGKGYVLAVQMDGMEPSLAPRLDGLRGLLPSDTPTMLLEGDPESALWSALRDVAWVGESDAVLRLYLPPNRLADLEVRLQDFGARRVYSVAGNVGWAALPDDPVRLAPALEKLGVRASVWRGGGDGLEILPALPGAALVKRIKRALDPREMFYPGRFAVG
jgi:glycolate oxidase FAD binding subunit